jgi:hypothetical protein
MKTSLAVHTFRCAAVVVALACSTGWQSLSADTPADSHPTGSPAGDELHWPRVFEDNGSTVEIYQPEIEKWQGKDLEGRAAVAITAPGSPTPVYGVVWIKARACVDKSARIVTLNDFAVTRVKFPTSPAQQNQNLALIRKDLPAVSKTVALDRLEASYAVSEAKKNTRVVRVNNDPPRILYSSSPALLVLVDGPPALRPMPVLEVERVINTRALILKVGSLFYLNAFDHWYESPAVEGPWSSTTIPPAILETAKQTVVASQPVDLMPPGPNAVTKAPLILVSTVPAEIVETEGPPRLVPVGKTDLMEAENSDNGLFFDNTDRHYYVVLSGRWFAAESLDGPWKFVPYKKLPADFAHIPLTDPKANVLVSVPGTPQAREAIIANSVPQTATIQRSTAKLDLNYNGPAEFRRLPGTPLRYAFNSATPVIEVDDHTYYSVQNAVWFVAAAPAGPWAVATSVPAAIYRIPSSSPLHYVTYVQVYGSTPDVVYVGYTPGYLGTVVTPDNVVVFGTGWHQAPYLGQSWYGYPSTYGFGAAFADGTEVGYAFGFQDGEDLGAWGVPWGELYDHGPYDYRTSHHDYYNNVSLNHLSLYDNFAPGVVQVENNYSVTVANDPKVAPAWSTHFNPYTSRALAQTAAAAFSAYHGNIHALALSESGSRPSTLNSRPFALYSDRDGNVYRNSQFGPWERSTVRGWEPAPAAVRAGLEQMAAGRTIGEQRVSSYRSHGGGYSHGGGAAHGGGGGGRR